MTTGDWLDQGDAAWAALCAQLDAKVDMIEQHPSIPWNARDVYAHLARWQGQSIVVVSRLLAGRPILPPEADETTLNARWAAEDASLSFDQARDRALEARRRLRDLMLTLSDAQWQAWGWKIDDIVGPHYREHTEV